MARLIITFCSLLLPLYGMCQSADSIAALIKVMQRGADDKARFSANDSFKSIIQQVITSRDTSLKIYGELKNVSIITSDDNKVKIYTWVVPHTDGQDYSFFGFIRYSDENSDTLMTLTDSTAVIQKPGSEKLSNSRWLGALYYDIITVKKSKKVYYTLLGWKATNDRVTQKVIDVLYFEKKAARFGFSLFKTGSVFKSRILFSYNANASMALRFDKNYKGIVFDHISENKNSPVPDSGPDGTYDGFRLKKGRWVLQRNIDARTRWEPSENLPVPPAGEK